MTQEYWTRVMGYRESCERDARWVASGEDTRAKLNIAGFEMAWYCVTELPIMRSTEVLEQCVHPREGAQCILLHHSKDQCHLTTQK